MYHRTYTCVSIAGLLLLVAAGCGQHPADTNPSIVDRETGVSLDAGGASSGGAGSGGDSRTEPGAEPGDAVDSGAEPTPEPTGDAGSPPDTPSPVRADAGPAADAAAPTPPDVAPPGEPDAAPTSDPMACSGGSTLCGGSCVDTDISNAHCGRCGNACGSARSCQSGSCRCPSGRSYCTGSCVDTTTDADHCGRCGNACSGGETCEKGTCKASSKVQIVISETNNVRSTKTDCGSQGVKSPASPVRGNKYLHKAAQAHADDMVMNGFFSHTGSDGSSFVTRVGRTNFSGTPVAENIAAGNSSARATVQQWVGSDGHCKNLMLQRATHIGVGVARGSRYGWYWVQVFGRK